MISLQFWHSQLGKKIVALMVAISALLSLGAAGVQLYLSYERDKLRAYDSFTVIQDSFLKGLERALWEYSTSQVEVLLEGIISQKDIVYVQLQTPKNQVWEKGHSDQEDMVRRDFQLTYRGRSNDEALGVLTAGLSLHVARARLWEQFWSLALTNFAKTLMASLAMLLIFDRLVARHLRRIEEQTIQDWLNSDKIVTIDRSQKHSTPDELDNIVAALNRGRVSIRKTHTDLAERIVEVESLNRKLEDTNREQAEFTYAISHDLKSPVNTVRMLLVSLREEVGEQVDEDSIEIFDDLNVTTERMGRLVDDVLAYARSVGNDMELADVDLRRETDGILRDLSGDITIAEASVLVGDLPTVVGNAMQLRLLLLNLISNAIKFRNPSRTPTVQVESSPTSDEKWVIITVRDNGIGIDSKFHKKIFGLFKRLNTHDRYTGSGIGLAICQRIVSNHGGTITLRSNKGQGSVFTVTLPRIANASHH